MGIRMRGLVIGHYGYSTDGYKAWLKEPNSAGGVSVKFEFVNTSTKTFKYTQFRLFPINSVGDVVADKISNEPVKTCQYTGFVPPNTCVPVMFENVWYNSTIVHAGIKEVVIQYTDGSFETIPGNAIEYEKAGGGCYVATAVYGSYDCPEVWTLRRYRDYNLAQTWYGRVFIKLYYTLSPTLVKWFGNTKWFKRLWRGKLDRMVKKLQDKGYKSTPYQDRDWR